MKLATIGRGFIVDRAIDALKDVENLELEAVYSRSKEDARDFAKKHQAKKAYWNLEEMLQDPDIDVVYIASPNTLHYPQAKAALKSGKHVILEKPFVSSMDQALDLFKTAEENGVMLFEAITTLHIDNFHILKDQLARAGDIHQVSLNFSRYNPKYDLYKKGKIPNTLSLEYDGGALMDLGVYNIHFATGLFGKPDSIQHFPNQGYTGIDTSGLLLMHYPSFTISATAGMDNQTPYLFYISGDKGTFQVDQGSVGQMNHVTFTPLPAGSDAKSEEISLPHRNHMSFEFNDFVKAIQEQDMEKYNKWKEQTLLVQEIVDEAKKQRNVLSGG